MLYVLQVYFVIMRTVLMLIILFLQDLFLSNIPFLQHYIVLVAKFGGLLVAKEAAFVGSLLTSIDLLTYPVTLCQGFFNHLVETTPY